MYDTVQIDYFTLHYIATREIVKSWFKMWFSKPRPPIKRSRGASRPRPRPEVNNTVGHRY